MTSRFGLIALLGLFVALSHQPVLAQSGGGLTALPPRGFGPNLVQNPSFEALSGGFPSSWGTGAGWGVDQLTVHSGGASYRRTTGAGTSSQNVQLRAGTYLLSGWVKTDALGSGSTSGVRLQLDFRVGGINAWAPSQVISGTNDWKLVQVGPVVVDTDRLAAVKLENYNGPAGTAWFDDVQLVQILPTFVDVFLLYPNYRGVLFDDQPQTIRLDVTVTPPGGDFGRHSVKAVLTDEASGQVVTQQSFPAVAKLVATLDGSTMQQGRTYLATISLIDMSTGASVGSYPAYRLSKVAGSARQSMNVSFDAKNRVLLRGAPRFVLGVYDSGLGYSTDPAFWENTLWSDTGTRRMSGLAINMYINYHYGQAPTTAMSALMNNLQQHGVMYLQTGNCFDRFAADPAFPINSSDAYVQTIGGHAGSAGYYTIDECQSALQPGAFVQYQRLRQLDADSVTFAALLGGPELQLWRDSADVLSTDPYPLFGAEPAGGYNLAQVADWTAATRAAIKDARPFMTVLQFFKFTSQGRFPTFAEMRSMAYMAIVEGARGLWWWSLGTNALQDVCAGWCAEKSGYMANLKAVVNEVAALEPVLLADDTPEALVANSNATAIRTKVKVVADRGYLFAYNYAGTQQSATFTWTTAPGTVTVNAEGRTVGSSGNAFSDTFGPYQAHVYVIATGAPSPLVASFSGPVTNGAVSATVPVTVTASGGSGTGYAYTIAVDGATISSGEAATVSWDTTTVVNGAHALSVSVTDSAGRTTTASQSVTVSNAVALTLSYNGKTRDRVGQGDFALGADGAVDGVLTATLSGGARTITGLRLDSTGPGTWDTTGGNPFWVLGVATTTDGALLNSTSTMAVSFSVPNGGSFVMFAADYNNIEFVAGAMLTLRATFSDGTTAVATTTVTAGSPSPSGVTLGLVYNGKARDRVGQGDAALTPDGALDGVLTATLTGGARSIVALRLDSTGPGSWDTVGPNIYWFLGVARSVGEALLNNPSTMGVNFMVPDGGSFVLFAADYNDIEFVPGTTLTLRAMFSDGSTATATTTVGTAVTSPAPSGASVTLAYSGKLRDRVGQGNTAMNADGAADGTLTMTLNAPGGRTVTGLSLQSSAPGTWDTFGTRYWVLGVATSLEAPLINNVSTMGVNIFVPDRAALHLFAADYQGIEFRPGVVLTLTVTFSDGTTGVASTVVP